MNGATAVQEDRPSAKTLISFDLKMPFKIVQWSPAVRTLIDCAINEHDLVLATRTIQSDNNYVISLNTRLRNKAFPATDEILPGENKLVFKTKIKHRCPINALKIMPQNSNIMVTKSNLRYLAIFDRQNYETSASESRGPSCFLRGHSDGGFAVDWNKNSEGMIVSGGKDRKLLLWDVNGRTNNDRGVLPLAKYNGHADEIINVNWSQLACNMFGSVGKEHMIRIWDIRDSSPSHRIKANSRSINSICFSPFSEYEFVTGSSDHSIRSYDLRRSNIFVNMTFQDTEVLGLEPSPHCRNIWASRGISNRINVWDLSGKSSRDLMFVYEHSINSNVNYIAWSTQEPWTMASIANAQELRVWQIQVKKVDSNN